MSDSKEYTFDVKLFAAIKVEASNKKEALDLIEKHITNEALDCNGGAWPNGDPILFIASSDGEPDLIEIDGEAV